MATERFSKEFPNERQGGRRSRQSELNYSLIFGRRHLELLIVVSRHGEQINAATSGIRTHWYDPAQRPAWYCIAFWFHRLFFTRRISREAKTLVAIARSLRVRGVISTDAYRGLIDAETHLPGTKLYWIQHGLFLDQGSFRLEREPNLPPSPTAITLFAVSPYDRKYFKRWGARPKRVLPVGSLKNGFYVSKLRNNSKKENLYDICIIEKGLKPHPDNELGIHRRDGWQTFFQQFSTYCSSRQPRVIVALSPSEAQQEVKRWICDYFNYEFVFAPIDDEFATYRASDASELTVGQTSTVLSESLSRKRKCLAINYTDIPFWDLPGDGISRLVRPNLPDLSSRLDYLLAIDWNQYWASIPQEVKDLTVEDPYNTLPIINEVLRFEVSDLDDSYSTRLTRNLGST